MEVQFYFLALLLTALWLFDSRCVQAYRLRERRSLQSEKNSQTLIVLARRVDEKHPYFRSLSIQLAGGQSGKVALDVLRRKLQGALKPDDTVAWIVKNGRLLSESTVVVNSGDELEVWFVNSGSPTRTKTVRDFAGAKGNKDIKLSRRSSAKNQRSSSRAGAGPTDEFVSEVSLPSPEEFQPDNSDPPADDSVTDSSGFQLGPLPILGPDESDPLPDITDPLPDESSPAPDITEPLPDESSPIPDINESLPGESSPIPDVTESPPDESAPDFDFTSPPLDGSDPSLGLTDPSSDIFEPLPDDAESPPDISEPPPDDSETAPDSSPETQTPEADQPESIPEQSTDAFLEEANDFTEEPKMSPEDTFPDYPTETSQETVPAESELSIDGSLPRTKINSTGRVKFITAGEFFALTRNSTSAPGNFSTLENSPVIRNESSINSDESQSTPNGNNPATAKNFSRADGHFSMKDGNLSITDGNFLTAVGNLLTTDRNVSMIDENVSMTDGNFSAPNRNFSTTGGNLTKTNGNSTIPPGNFSTVKSPSVLEESPITSRENILTPEGLPAGKNLSPNELSQLPEGSDAVTEISGPFPDESGTPPDDPVPLPDDSEPFPDDSEPFPDDSEPFPDDSEPLPNSPYDSEPEPSSTSDESGPSSTADESGPSSTADESGPSTTSDESGPSSTGDESEPIPDQPDDRDPTDQQPDENPEGDPANEVV